MSSPSGSTLVEVSPPAPREQAAGFQTAATSWRWQLAVAGSVVAPVAVALALVPFRSAIDGTNVALILVAVVVAAAATGGRLAGAVGAVSAALSFDFFFTRPYESLTIANHADIETAVLLLVVGLIVGELSARSTRHRIHADESSADIARLHAVAEMVSTGADGDQVVLAVRNELKHLLRLRDCTFTRSFANRPRPHLEPDGEVIIAGMRWGASHMGLPGKEVDLVVQSRGRRFGRFVMVPEPGAAVSWDRRVVAVALADQVGAALADSGVAR